MPRVDRRTVDLSAYPDLVVIYLGMRVNAFSGLKRLLGLGPQIADSVKARPDGLLLHEDFIFSLFPLHAGMRQYWRDFESLERWTRSSPTANGGSASCATPAAPASGTKPTPCAAASKPFMTTCPSPSA